MHNDLKFAGALPPLDAPHHLRASEWGAYREGVVRRAVQGTGSFIDVGLEKDAFIEHDVEENVRVTVKLGSEARHATVQGQAVYRAQLVHPGGIELEHSSNT